MFSPEKPSDIVASALRVAGLGLRIHPLRRKHAILEDWPAVASADCDTIRGLAAPAGEHNYGIVCDLVAVIDTDSAELTAWWEKNMPQTPWRVRTPRGGRHFYYRSVPGLRNAVKAHRGWDVRAGGRGYVVGAGSIVDGRTYELLGEETLDLPLVRSGVAAGGGGRGGGVAARGEAGKREDSISSLVYPANRRGARPAGERCVFPRGLCFARRGKDA